MALESLDLTLGYPGGKGLFDVSLGLGGGQVLGVLGPNGSGKTTLLSLLAGLRAPTSGSVRWFGSHTSPGPSVRRRLGVLLDSPAHFDHLSGYQNAWFFTRLMGVGAHEAGGRLRELLVWVGLWEDRDRPVREYSLGMKRRLALVEALAHRPPLLLLDEPTLALDFGAELNLIEALARLAGEGCAVLVATNDVPLAERLCERVAFLHEGRLLRDGSRASLLREVGTATRLELRLRSPVDVARVRALPGVAAAGVGGDRVVAVLADGAEPARVLAGLDGQGALVTEMQVRRPDLGDVFLKLTGATLEGASPHRLGSP